MVNIKIAKEKATEAQLTYKEWQAFLKHFEDCTCTPGSALACPSCRDYNRRKYGLEEQECTCLPDLPDGRGNGGRGGCCPACSRKQIEDEIPY